MTYGLHVIIRFELEQELIGGRLDPAELPAAWSERTAEYLGLDVPDDANGVLQDIHWAAGSFGYFPTYSLGNVIAAQLFAEAGGAIPGLDDLIAAGNFMPLHEWLNERLYRHGGRFESPDMVKRILGRLDPGPLLDHLRGKLAGD